MLNAQGGGMDAKIYRWCLVVEVLSRKASAFLINCFFFTLGLPFHCVYDLCLPYSRQTLLHLGSDEW